MASGSFPPPPGGEPPSSGNRGWDQPSQPQGWDQPSQPQGWDQAGQGGGEQGWGAPGPGGFPGPPPPARSNGSALASMICGIISLVCLLLFFFLITIPVAVMTAVAALITGFLGLRAARHPGAGGRGQAIAGLVMGGLSLVLVVVVSLAAISAWRSFGFESNPLTDPEGFLTELEERGVQVDEDGQIDIEDLQRELDQDGSAG